MGIAAVQVEIMYFTHTHELWSLMEVEPHELCCARRRVRCCGAGHDTTMTSCTAVVVSVKLTKLDAVLLNQIFVNTSRFVAFLSHWGIRTQLDIHIPIRESQ